MGVCTVAMLFAVLVLFALTSSLQAFLLDDLVRQEKWDGLKVTWGPNPLSSSYFVDQPRTVTDALAQGWVKIQSCDRTAAWRGERYVKNNDFAVILLFDVAGYIAGIQTSVTPTAGYPSANIRPPFVPDGDRMTLTAYFVPPSVICSTGRSAADFAANGTGPYLSLQRTMVPEDATYIPATETGIANTRWTKGKCFLTMGMHYWYDISENMNCNDFFPVFLLYNSGRLTAFGWALGDKFSSPTYEHPSDTVIPLFMQTPPKCILSAGAAGTLSTQHIYLTSSAAKDLC